MKIQWALTIGLEAEREQTIPLRHSGAEVMT